MSSGTWLWSLLVLALMCGFGPSALVVAKGLVVGRVVGGGAVSLWGWIDRPIRGGAARLVHAELVLVGAGRRACLASSGIAGPRTEFGSLGASGVRSGLCMYTYTHTFWWISFESEGGSFLARDD